MKRILCYGDSNTYGYDPRSYLGGRYPEDMRDIARAAIQAFPVDIVTVMLGGNDLLQNKTFTAEDVTSRMERFLRELKANILDVRLLLIVPPPMHPGAWVYEERLLKESARLRMNLLRSLRSLLLFFLHRIFLYLQPDSLCGIA